MRLHPQAEAWRRRLEEEPTVSTSSIKQIRQREADRFRDFGGALQDVAELRELTIPAADREIPAILYRPALEPAPGILVWLHGGGWIVSSPALVEDQTRAIANASGCAVLSVDYRLAPEHPFPAGLEDAYEALRWTAEHAEDSEPVRARSPSEATARAATSRPASRSWRATAAGLASTCRCSSIPCSFATATAPRGATSPTSSR